MKNVNIISGAQGVRDGTAPTRGTDLLNGLFECIFVRVWALNVVIEIPLSD
jgi:hypothetical protein